MWNIIDKLRRYFRFNMDEVKSIIISSVIIGFVFALRNWTDATIGDFIISVLIVLVSVIFHASLQKVLAIHIGFNAEFKLWWQGIFIGLIVSIASMGKVWWLILPGGVIFSFMARHRLGKFRYGLNYWPMGWIGFTGPVASIILGTIFKNIELYIAGAGIPLFHSIFVFNLAFAVTSMLPIPPLDGHYMFFASRPWYAVLFGTVFAYAILVALDIYSWIWAIIIGIIIWLVYYLTFEKTAW
jgi:hypothetical protein